MWPSQIKKLVARAERSNEPSTTAQTDYYRLLLQTTDTTEIPLTEILGRIFNDAPDLIRARVCEGASILFFPGLGEHIESHLGAAWSGRSLPTCLRSWQARLAAQVLESASFTEQQAIALEAGKSGCLGSCCACRELAPASRSEAGRVPA